jgi:hypothetical protein
MPVSVIGEQKVSIAAKIDLFLTGTTGDNPELISVGSQEYNITGEGSTGFNRTPKLPSEFITDPVVEAVSSAVTAVVSEFVPQPTTQQKAKGPLAFLQLNRLHIFLPYNKPEGQYVLGNFGAYSDEAMTKQMVDAGFDVLFCTDQYLSTQFGTQDSEAIAALRSDRGIFQLSQFFGGDGVMDAISLVAGTFFAELKAKCDQWEDIDVQTIMQNFGAAVTQLA